MSQDVVADAMNQMMNAKRAGKDKVEVGRYSKLLLSVLAIGRLKGYIKDYKTKDRGVDIQLGEKFNACRAIKPRYVVKVKDIEKYVRRYLPARGFGVLIISTNEGLMTHQTALNKEKGGCVVAYFY